MSLLRSAVPSTTSGLAFPSFFFHHQQVSTQALVLLPPENTYPTQSSFPRRNGPQRSIFEASQFVERGRLCRHPFRCSSHVLSYFVVLGDILAVSDGVYGVLGDLAPNDSVAPYSYLVSYSWYIGNLTTCMLLFT